MRFDADRHGNLALGLEGGHGAAASPTPAAARPAAGSCARCRRGRRRARADRGARGPPRRARWRWTAPACGSDDGRAIGARAVVLATGGAAALWSRTTNPPGSFGSGLLLARAAGAALADLEFVQFHPTAVVGLPGREGFLISEAVRGEGATLHDAGGERFVDELAPRDAVARAIFNGSRARAPVGRARHARRRPRPLPQRRRRAARGRARTRWPSSSRSRPPATT